MSDTDLTDSLARMSGNPSGNPPTHSTDAESVRRASGSWAKNEGLPASKTVSEAAETPLPSTPSDEEMGYEPDKARGEPQKPQKPASPGQNSSASAKEDKEDADMEWADEVDRKFQLVKNRRKEARELKRKESEEETRLIIATLWPTKKERTAFF